MLEIIKNLANIAKRVRTFLTLSAFLALIFVAIFLWSFSKGAFDISIAKLSSEQTFQLLVIIAFGIFIILATLIVLSFLDTRPVSKNQIGYPIFVVIHENDDRTRGIANATVILNLIPKPMREITDSSGTVTFYFPIALQGNKYDINVQKEGYIYRKPKRITLKDSAQEFLGLQKAITLEDSKLSLLPSLQVEFENAASQCLNYQSLGYLKIWPLVKSQNWFSDEVILCDISPLSTFFEAIENYISLEHKRGSGHTIEAWVRQNDIRNKYEQAKHTFSEINSKWNL
jgi:hypothetical protein